MSERHRSKALLACVALASLLLVAAPAGAQVAEFVSPENGATDVPGVTTFSWTSVPDVQAYYLYVGTTPGAKNVVDTSETLQTSYVATLPDTATLYARLWTKRVTWSFVDIVFSTVNLRAGLVSPANSAATNPSSTTFQWTAVANAQTYYLYVGTAVGLKDVVDTGETIQTTHGASNLPENQALYARLWTRAEGSWRYTDSTFSTLRVRAELASPMSGATSNPSATTFQWTAIANAERYYLYVGTAVGLKDVVDTGETLQTTYWTSTLPENQTLYVRLWTKAGAWRYTDSTFSTLRVRTTLVSPASEAVTNPSATTFQWTALANAERYYLYVGTAVGLKDVVDTGETLQTTYVASNLPEDLPLYTRLWTKAAGAWRYTDSTFSTLRVRSALINPTSGAATHPFATTFQWTALANAEAYYLYVGTAVGLEDVVDTGETLQTTYGVSNLPENQTLHARLWTKAAGAWRYTDSTLSTLQVRALLTAPAGGSTEVPVSTAFEWTPIATALTYYLNVGTTPGAADVVDSGELANSSYVAASLPPEQTLHARLWTKDGTGWRFVDSSFSTVSLRAELLDPVDGSDNVSRLVTFQWSSIAGATAYTLHAGTTPGASDVANSGEVTALAYSATIPGNAFLHLRLWTLFDGGWRYRDASIRTARTRSTLQYPADGQIGVDLTSAFSWQEVIGADGYQLVVSDAPTGGQVYLDTGTTTELTASMENLPSDRPLYARLFTTVSGARRFTDAVFSGQPSILAAVTTYPTQQDQALDRTQPFRWNEVPLAQAYSLQLGTTPGGTDLHDSGPILSQQRFVPNLPTGAVLFGRVGTQIAGAWQYTDFEFLTIGDVAAETDLLAIAIDDVGLVRTMAAPDNTPGIGSRLARKVSGMDQIQALCNDFRDVLLESVADANTGLTLRGLDVGFTPNSDTHTLVEIWSETQQAWIVLDPTFGFAVKNTTAGTWATADDIQSALDRQAWTDITFNFTTSQGDAYARGYYLDYPLLYNNVYLSGGPTSSPARSVVAFIDSLGTSVNQNGTYLLQCADSRTSATVSIEHQLTTVTCFGSDNLTPLFHATSIEPAADAPTISRVRRLVF